MRFIPLFFIIFVFSSLATDLPKAIPTAPALIEGEMIVWAGAKTREKAEKQLENFEDYSTALGDVVTGLEPVVFESSKIEGLKPGFFIVSLGICKKADLDFALKTFQALHPDVYTRTVKYRPPEHHGRELSCPMGEIMNDDSINGVPPARWRFQKAVRMPAGKNVLIGMIFDYTYADLGDFAGEYFNVKNLFVLVNSDRKILDNLSYSGPTDTTNNKAYGVQGNSFNFSVDYADPRCAPSNDSYTAWSMDAKVTVEKGNKLKLFKSKPHRGESGTCGFKEEAEAISGERRGN